jgi:formate dehydrogenase subunit beta
MAEVLKIQKAASDGLRDLLTWLISEGKVRGVFGLITPEKGDGAHYALLTDAEQVKRMDPFLPVMPVNAAGQISRLTLDEPLSEPVAVVMRPCELRAFVELVKLKQAHLENILFISMTCPGVYPFEVSRNGDLQGRLSGYWEAAKNASIPEDIRPACRACEEFIPHTADVTVPLIKTVDPGSEFQAVLNTEKAREILKGFEPAPSEGSLDTESLTALKDTRKNEKEAIFAQMSEGPKGLDGLVDTFGRCIACHGCMQACPICACKICYFDSRESDWKPERFEVELRARGATRLPPGTVFFHLGRLTHMSVSCVGCGQCSEVCPVDIPLASIFLKVGESVQRKFDYLPGRDAEEEIPLMKFEKEEFQEVGES